MYTLKDIDNIKKVINDNEELIEILNVFYKKAYDDGFKNGYDFCDECE